MDANNSNVNALVMQILMTRGHPDPYPIYRELHEAGPVLVGEHATVVVGFDAAEQAVRDSRIAFPPSFLKARTDAWAQSARHWLIYQNPPQHTRVRKLVSKAFTPAAVERLRPAVQALVDRYLDAAEAAGEIDVIADIGFPLPIDVVGELFGIPVDDRPQLRVWTADIVPVIDAGATAEDSERAGAATVAIDGYFRELVRRRRENPGEDVLSRLAVVRDDDDRLTDDEIASNASFLVMAGFETTAYSLGNALLTLLDHPDELEQLRRDPSLIKPAVEEVLRYEPVVHLPPPRTALEPVQLGGTRVPQGHPVIVLPGAANRDPRRFASPDTFDIDRTDAGSLTFSGGIHYCLGAALARMEMQEAVGRMVERFGVLERMEDKIVWRRQMVLRGLERLPIRCKPC